MSKKVLNDYQLEIEYQNLSSDSFLYDRLGPWPQPSANHPFGEVPGVLHLPFIESLNWWKKIGLRFLKDLVLYTPVAIIEAFKNNGLHFLSDKQMAEYFWHTCYAKYLTSEISDFNKSLFSEYFTPGKSYFIVDFTAQELLDPIANQHCEKSITLFEISVNFIKPVAINLKNFIVNPNDGDLWLLAKYIVMQGASNHINLEEHPKLHFPMDPINAITKTSVPKNHILFQLIYPHLEISLKLNYQVLNNPTSLLANKSWMIYGPFPATSSSLRDLVVVGYSGIKGNPSYNKYEFPINGPKKVSTPFGTFHDSYYPAYYEFANNILSQIPKQDRFVTNWANYINQQIPSFPNGIDIWKEDTLVKAVAVILWDVTLGHAVDHKTYSEIPVYHNPMRMRTACPQNKDKDFKLNLSASVSIIDQAKWIMANRLFYKPWNIANLVKVNYGFQNPILDESVENFRKKLKQIENKLIVKNLMPVDEIPSSIQY